MEVLDEKITLCYNPFKAEIRLNLNGNAVHLVRLSGCPAGYIVMMKPTPDNFRPPAPGDKVFFVCHNCGHRFLAVVRILPFPTKCPQCGSLNTDRDAAIRH
jgi:hypothetical protein